VAAALERWRANQDRDALGELLKWQRGRAYATALRIVRDPDDAEDVVQQAFVKVLNLRKVFPDAAGLERAVYWAVTQCALNWKASDRARQRRETTVNNLEHASSETPLTAAQRAEALRAIDDELQQLAPDARAAVVLCCQEGLSLTDAAGALETSRETLRDRLAGALAALRKRLKRKGVTLSLVMCFGLMRSTRAESAPPSLCAKLDMQFPRTPCREIPEAPPADTGRAEVLHELGSHSQPLIFAAVALVLMSLMLGILAGSAKKMEMMRGIENSSPPIAAPGRTTERDQVAAQTSETHEEGTAMNTKRAGAAAAVVAATMLGGSAQAGDGDGKISRDDIKAAVRAVLEREKNPPANLKASSGQDAIPSVKAIRDEQMKRERD
jgi:RNA polymerase sigma-70 factor (ECF subfamily)